MHTHFQRWFYIVVLFTLTTAFLLEDAQADGFSNLVGRRHRPAERARREVTREASAGPPVLAHIRRGSLADEGGLGSETYNRRDIEEYEDKVKHNLTRANVDQSKYQSRSSNSTEGDDSGAEDSSDTGNHSSDDQEDGAEPDDNGSIFSGLQNIIGSTVGQDSSSDDQDTGYGPGDKGQKSDESDDTDLSKHNGDQHQDDQNEQEAASNDQEDLSNADDQSENTTSQNGSGDHGSDQKDQDSSAGDDNSQESTEAVTPGSKSSGKASNDTSRASDASEFSKASNASDASRASDSSNASDASDASEASNASDASHASDSSRQSKNPEGKKKPSNGDDQDDSTDDNAQNQDDAGDEKQQKSSSIGEHKKTTSSTYSNGSEQGKNADQHDAKQKASSNETFKQTDNDYHDNATSIYHTPVTTGAQNGLSDSKTSKKAYEHDQQGSQSGQHENETPTSKPSQSDRDDQIAQSKNNKSSQSKQPDDNKQSDGSWQGQKSQEDQGDGVDHSADAENDNGTNVDANDTAAEREQKQTGQTSGAGTSNNDKHTSNDKGAGDWSDDNDANAVGNTSKENHSKKTSNGEAAGNSSGTKKVDDSTDHGTKSKGSDDGGRESKDAEYSTGSGPTAGKAGDQTSVDGTDWGSSPSAGDDDTSADNKQTNANPSLVQSLVNGKEGEDKADQQDSATNSDEASKKKIKGSETGDKGSDGKGSTWSEDSDGSNQPIKSSSSNGTSSGDTDNEGTKTTFDSGGNNNSTSVDGSSGDDAQAQASNLVGASLQQDKSGKQISASKTSGTSQFGQASDQYSNQNNGTSAKGSNGNGSQQDEGNPDKDAKQAQAGNPLGKSGADQPGDGNPSSNTNSTVAAGAVIGQQGTSSAGGTSPPDQAAANVAGQSGSASTGPAALTGSSSLNQNGEGTAASTLAQGDPANGSAIASTVANPSTATSTSSTTTDAANGAGSKTTSAGPSDSTEPGTLIPSAATGVIAGTQDQPSNSSNEGNAQGSTTEAKTVTSHQSSTTESTQHPDPTATAKSGSAFGWANTKQLLLPGVASGQKNESNGTDGGGNGDDKATQTHGSSASSSSPNVTAPGSTAQSPLPLMVPSTIVPTGASTVQPPGTVMVAILFKPVLSWNFLASSPNTVAQIFLYMPTLLAEAVGLDNSTVMTIRLQVHYPTEARPTKRAVSDGSEGRSLYLAYLPSQTAATLQDKIRNSTSEFYTMPTNPVAKSLADNADPSYDITSMTSVGTANQAASRSDGDGNSTVLRNALIGVGTALASCILAFFIWRLWKRKEKHSRRDAAQNVLSRGVAQRGTIHSFGGNNGLRETWTPSVLEQERVLHGQLAETWEHNNEGQAQPIADTHDPDMGFIGGLATHRAPSSRGHSDVFADQVTNRSSQETERSTGHNPQRNTLLSHLNSFDNRSTTSVASRMTEAQRIQQQYFEGQAHLERDPPRPTPGALLYQGEYQRPPQNTSHHAYGTRNIESRSGRSDGSRYSRTSRASLSTGSIGRPELQCNSMCM